jgi:hypothetical protein
MWPTSDILYSFKKSVLYYFYIQRFCNTHHNFTPGKLSAILYLEFGNSENTGFGTAFELIAFECDNNTNCVK